MTGAMDPFATCLLAWFDTHGRHDLPWTQPRSPYRVWLSEIMLQQTQVSVVIPYFQRFMDALPDVQALASAPVDTVLALWSGLGYYARARNLQAAARICVELHGSGLPRDFDALVALPGIGRSTAGAILAQAWGDPWPILDGNAKRVLARYHGIDGWPGSSAVEKSLWAMSASHVPATRMADYTQALMDLGATLCTRHSPGCDDCPLATDCLARRDGSTARIPAPKPGKTVPRREATVLWLEDAQGRVLLQRRPPTGVWASLWSLPQHQDTNSAMAWLDGEGIRAPALEPIADVAHAFSHYRLTLHPLRGQATQEITRVRDNDAWRWVTREEFSRLGLPAPIRRLLEPAP